MSKQSTLSQVAQLPHCRLWLDTTSQWNNLHHPNLHSACSPHSLHLQHWQPRWTRLQLFLSCQLFKRMPWHQCLWHPMPHLCSHKDLAIPTQHPDTWSRKSKNSWPRLSTDLVIVMHHHIHPQSFVRVKLQCVIFSERGMLYYHLLFNQSQHTLWVHPSHTFIRFPTQSFCLKTEFFYLRNKS